MQIWFLSYGSYSLKNCHNPFGKAIQPPLPYGKMPVEHLKSLHMASQTVTISKIRNKMNLNSILSFSVITELQTTENMYEDLISNTIIHWRDSPELFWVRPGWPQVPTLFPDYQTSQAPPHWSQWAERQSHHSTSFAPPCIPLAQLCPTFRTRC